MALVLVAVIAVVDVVIAAASPLAFLAHAALDHTGHLATTAIILLVLHRWGWRLGPPFVVAALVASVAIDLDHLPAELGSRWLTHGTPRPYTHSLATLTVVTAVATLTRSRRQPVVVGVLVGLASHLFRDLATGPGVALLWPLASRPVQIPYVAYLAALASAGGWVWWSRSRSRW